MDEIEQPDLERTFRNGATDARLYPRWSCESLMQGYGDYRMGLWTKEEKNAYRKGYESVRGAINTTNEHKMDTELDQRLQAFQTWMDNLNRTTGDE